MLTINIRYKLKTPTSSAHSKNKQEEWKKKNGDNNFDPLVKFEIYMFGYRNISLRVSVICSS